MARHFWSRLLFVVLALASVTAFAQAPWKPQRPVELIVGSAAGNSNDLMLRLIAQTAQEKRLLHVPMNVMNKPGGGNTIAWNYLNQHASDGHLANCFWESSEVAPLKHWRSAAL